MTDYTPTAREYFDRMKTHPVEGAKNWLEWYKVDGDTRTLVKVEYPEWFTKPCIYYNGEWVSLVGVDGATND